MSLQAIVPGQRKVFKYPLVQPGSSAALRFGPSAKLLHLGLDPASGLPALWVEVDVGEADPTSIGPATHEALLIGTGWVVPDAAEGWAYFGTAHHDPYIWHLYVRGSIEQEGKP